jgi:hypothetical protein
MAKLLLINHNTKRDNNNIGDIVAIYEDNQEETELEKINFEVVRYAGTAQQVRAQMRQAQPEVRQMYFDREKQEWLELEKMPKYIFSFYRDAIVENLSRVPENSKTVNKK